MKPPHRSCIALFEKNPVTVIDIGARGGFELIASLHPVMEVYAVEPEPKAANELRKLVGLPFRKFSVHELAIADQDGEAQLNITRNASMCSLLGPDEQLFARGFGEMKNMSDWNRSMEVVAKAKVKKTTLASFHSEYVNRFIDFLKIDTQGTEFLILKSGKELLESGGIGVICVEASLLPVYKNQKLFADIDIFLRECGFNLVEFRTYPDIVEREHEFSNGDKIYERPKTNSTGDAWYVFNWNTHNNSKLVQRQRCAMVLASEGYFSEAAHLLRGIIDTTSQNELFRNLSAISHRKQLKRLMKRWTPMAVQQWRAKRRKK